MKDKETEILDNAKKLHLFLFQEEFDHMYDSYADAKDRANRISPINKEYREKVKDKRKKLGVSPLSSDGNSTDNTSMQLCIVECTASSKNRITSKTFLIKEILAEIQTKKDEINKLITSKQKVIEDIDPVDPGTWSEIMIQNSYALLEAADKWELIKTMPFEEFVDLLFNDQEFSRQHRPRPGMEKEDYNPWKT